MPPDDSWMAETMARPGAKTSMGTLAGSENDVVDSADAADVASADISWLDEIAT